LLFVPLSFAGYPWSPAVVSGLIAVLLMIVVSPSLGAVQGMLHAAVDARPTASPGRSTSAASPLATGRPSPTDSRPRTVRFRCRTGRPSRRKTSSTSTTRRAEFRERSIPSPEHVTTDPQRLSDERRYDVPVTVIATEFSSEMLQGWLEQGLAPVREFTKLRDVEYVDLPTGHWPQFTRPEQLARAILHTLTEAHA
jgi:pimeloyl-ACP methyl ester carboxylesterase